MARDAIPCQPIHEQISKIGGFIKYNGTMEVHSSLLSVVLNDQPHIRE